ncbi:MAG: hypothetical protein H0T65_23335 [Deltaproteobacteria bacterium]|nr:hypothetical protein [Deltaproteobacteria bacterium]
MAAQLKQDLGVETELVVGGSGEFTVWVDGKMVAEKTRGVFPEPAVVVTAVRGVQPVS